MKRNSFNIALFYTLFYLYRYIFQYDYRQGVDQSVFNIHIPTIYYSYIFIALLVLSYVNTKNKYKDLKLINYLSIISSVSLLISGFFWGWTQWGSLIIMDTKIIIVLIIFIVLLTTEYISYFIIHYKKLSIFFMVYVIYHLPILKYNVLWNSELHQRKSLSFNDLFVITYNANILIFITIVTLNGIVNIFIKKKKLNILLHKEKSY